uniref:Secreted protein n=1 Tax=Arundo donax TaxID=35708 RepID=A0A0A8YED6_ARUDO
MTAFIKLPGVSFFLLFSASSSAGDFFAGSGRSPPAPSSSLWAMAEASGRGGSPAAASRWDGPKGSICLLLNHGRCSLAGGWHTF